MNRIEFMAELEVLLQDIAPEERVEALQYYNDYFDDAGAEQEESIIRELGSPAKVAEEVKAGLKTDGHDTAEYRETGYTDTRFEHKESPVHYEQKKESENAYEYADISNEEKVENEQRTNKTLKYILIGVLAVFGIPIVAPLTIALLATIFGLLIAVAAVVMAAIIVVAVLVVVGVALIVAGFSIIVPYFASGIALIGIGLIVGVIGAVASVGAVYGCAKLIPIVFRSIVKLCKKPFEKRKAVE